MPTGYTAIIEEKDPTFREFVWMCARAFGALIEMRESSLDAPIPQKIVPSDRHEKEISKEKMKLAKYEAMSLLDAEKLAADEYAKRKIEYDKSAAKERAIMAKYDRMVEQIHAWTPPTEAHVGLKKFMLDQIATSTEYKRKRDDGPDPYAPVKLSGEEYKKQCVEHVHDMIKFHEKHLAYERKAADSSNEWLDALRESVGDPP